MNARRELGFSLIELMVAMSLLGLIGVMAAGGIRFGHSAWERTGKISDGTIEKRAVAKYLRRQFDAALPVRVRDGSRTAPAYFAGDAESVTFLAPLAAEIAPDGMYVIGIDADPDGLFLDYRTIDALGAEGAPERERLLAGVTDVQFRFWGRRTADDLARWHARWTGEPSLPDSVEITAFHEDRAMTLTLSVGGTR